MKARRQIIQFSLPTPVTFLELPSNLQKYTLPMKMYRKDILLGKVKYASLPVQYGFSLVKHSVSKNEDNIK
jgi:hypothetical protein